MKKDNITLIGMAGAGKSTIGKLLAKKINFKFIDGDEYIEKQEKMSLPKIINTKGDKRFLKIEEKRILELLPLKKTVLAPGGSVIYLKKLMNILKKSSLVIFLNKPYNVLKKHLDDEQITRIVGSKSKSIKEIYTERLPLYKKYADFVINCAKKSKSKIVNEIIRTML